jgi:putative transposase
MPRKPRVFSPHIAYHIIARGNNRSVLFRSDHDFRRYLELLAFFKTQYAFDVFHYCLMTNHVHLLMRFGDREAFQKVPQRLQLNYAKHVAAKYQHVGHVFQDRFRSLPVEDNRYMLECGRYIERNPVNAGMVGVAEDYRWSSHRFYALGEPNRLITCNPQFADLGPDDGSRRARYREMVGINRPYEEAVEERMFGRSRWAKVAP